MKLLLLIPCFLISKAFAVDITQCPREILVTYTALAPVSDYEMNGFSNSAYYNRDLLRQAVLYDFQNLRFWLFDTSRERCRYLPHGQRAHGFNETRLFTRDGQDILRVAIRIGPEFFWIVHRVEDYSPASVTIMDLNFAYIFGEMLHGAPRTVVGRAIVPLIE